MSLSPAGREALERGCRDLGAVLSSGSMDLLASYGSRLLRHGRERGVTALCEEADVVRELLVDSLAAAPLLPSGACLADLGSGGGLPGLPLALARPDTRWLLVESARSKAEWLRECVEQAGVADRVEVWQVRAEDLGRDPSVRGCLQGVVSKALASLPVLLELALPLLEVGGRLYAYKGPALEEELARSTRALAELGAGPVDTVPYRLGDRNRVLCVVEKASPTPDRYPRRAGVPERKPL